MKYISTLREGERINEIFLCKSKQTAMTKSGKPYDNVILQDKTGIYLSPIAHYYHMLHRKYLYLILFSK